MQKNLRVSTLIKREFLSYINSPLAYLVIVPILLISNFLFFRTALVMGDANLRPFVELMPWLLTVIAPALAMRVFADEKRKGTIELLFAHPLSEWQIVISKYLGLLLFYLAFIATTITLPLTLFFFSQPDVGLMLAQYLGLFFVGATFLAIGVATSTYIEQAVGSFLTAAALCFSLILIGLQFVVLMVPAPFNVIFNELTVMTHLNNISRGLVDLRDVVYFVSIIGTCLVASVLRLSERKVAEMPAEKSKLYLIMLLTIGIGIAGNFLLYTYPVQLDLTANQRYSMSKGTRQLLQEIPDRLTITLYSSNNLPGPMQVTLREISDRMKDFERFGDKIAIESVSVVDPDQKQTAQSAGIREVTFNQIAAGSLQVQTGYLGIVVRYGEDTEVLPFIEDASQLEYQLSRLISKLTRDKQYQIGLLSTSFRTDSQALDKLISDQYEVILLSNDSGSSDYDELQGIVVVDNGLEENASAAAQLSSYIDAGGNVLAFIDGVNVDAGNTITSQVSSSTIPELFSQYGIRVQNSLVYDVQLNEAVSFNDPIQQVQYTMPYPFWVRGLVNSNNLPWGGGARNILLPWVSSISLSASGDYQVSPIVQTATTAGVQEENFTLEPITAIELRSISGEEYVLGAVAIKDSQRISVIADTDMVSTDVLTRSPENINFVSNAVDWIAADEVLSAIPQRSAGRSVFTFTSEDQLILVQYINLIVPPLFVVFFGVYWLRRRRLLTKRVYSPNI